MFLLSIIVINVSDYIIRKIQKQNMYKTEIKGVVWDIFLKRGGHHYYYNKDNKNEYFTDDDFFQDRSRKNIVIGDSIYKPSHSKEIYIYRKVNNKYKLVVESR